MQIIISKEYYEELLKYKALYENEKSHTETLEAIIDRILPHNVEVLPIKEAGEIEILDFEDEIETDDKTDTNNKVSEMDPTAGWTEEQREDVNKAIHTIANTIAEHLF